MIFRNSLVNYHFIILPTLEVKLLSWHVRGAGRKGFKNQIRIILNSYDLDIVIIMEIKISIDRE